MYPSVYLYKETQNGYNLYLGEVSTLEGVSLLPNEIEVELIEAGATNYKKYGWATEKELPKFRTIKEIINFLKDEEDIGLINFEIELVGIGVLRTHDDGECHFILKDKSTAIDLIKSIAPENYKTMILSTLLENSGMYISVDQSGGIRKYYTFDQYLKEGNS
jgi:hypothetical protein